MLYEVITPVMTRSRYSAPAAGPRLRMTSAIPRTSTGTAASRILPNQRTSALLFVPREERTKGRRCSRTIRTTRSLDRFGIRRRSQTAFAMPAPTLSCLRKVILPSGSTALVAGFPTRNNFVSHTLYEVIRERRINDRYLHAAAIVANRVIS